MSRRSSSPGHRSRSPYPLPKRLPRHEAFASALSYDFCESADKRCTEDNCQVDPIVAETIQTVGTALAYALVWFSKKKLVGANAILGDRQRAKIVKIVTTYFVTKDDASAYVEIIEAERFTEIATGTALVKFFEVTWEVTDATAYKSLVAILKALHKVNLLIKDYAERVNNYVATSMFFGVTLTETTTANMILLNALNSAAALTTPHQSEGSTGASSS